MAFPCDAAAGVRLGSAHQAAHNFPLWNYSTDAAIVRVIFQTVLFSRKVLVTVSLVSWLQRYLT